MAVHLKIDFRVLELSNSLHVLQCDRQAGSCEHEIEYNPRVSGSLLRAIREFRRHTCTAAALVSRPLAPRPGVLPFVRQPAAAVRPEMGLTRRVAE